MNSSLARNAIYKGILNIFNLLIPLLVGPYIAWRLDPQLYGVYNRVHAEFQIFLIIGGFGIYNYGVREISKVRQDPQKFRSLFTGLFVIGILANLLITLVYVVYFMARGTGIDRYIYFVMILQLVGNVFYIEFVNEAVENYKFITLKTILIRAAYFVSIFVFVRKPSDIIIYSVVVSMTVLCNNLASFFYLKRTCKFDFKHIDILPHILPLIVNLIFVNVELLYSQLDKVMLGYFVSDISVTEYTLPTTLVGMVGTVPLSLISVAIPRLSQYAGDNDKESYMTTLRATSRTFFSILVPMVFGILVLCREIMWLYTKDVYTYTFPVLACAACARIVYAHESIASNLIMYVNGKERLLTLFVLCGGIVNVVLNLLLVFVRAFTPLTALLTTIVASFVSWLLSYSYSRKHLGIRSVFFTKENLRYFCISATFIPVALLVNLLQLGYLWNIVIEVVLCVGIYGSFLLITHDPLAESVLQKLHIKKQ